MFLQCTQCIADGSLAAQLENCLYTVFYLSLCTPFLRFFTLDSMKQLVALAEPLLSTFVPLFEEDPAPSCYLSLFLPLLKPLAFAPEATSIYSHIVTLLNCFVSTEDETLESTLRLCRLEVLEILLMWQIKLQLIHIIQQ